MQLDVGFIRARSVLEETARTVSGVRRPFKGAAPVTAIVLPKRVLRDGRTRRQHYAHEGVELLHRFGEAWVLGDCSRHRCICAIVLAP